MSYEEPQWMTDQLRKLEESGMLIKHSPLDPPPTPRIEDFADFASEPPTYEDAVSEEHRPGPRGEAMSYECDNDNHDIGCQCPGRTPDFTDLLKRDLLAYVKSLGFSDEDAERNAAELLAFVMAEAERFT